MEWTEMDGSQRGLDWNSLVVDWTKQDWTGLNRTGLDWTSGGLD